MKKSLNWVVKAALQEKSFNQPVAWEIQRQEMQNKQLQALMKYLQEETHHAEPRGIVGINGDHFMKRIGNWRKCLLRWRGKNLWKEFYE